MGNLTTRFRTFKRLKKIEVVKNIINLVLKVFSIHVLSQILTLRENISRNESKTIVFSEDKNIAKIKRKDKIR